MATEARRLFFRIGPNYTRLALTLLLGIELTRLQFTWLGAEAFGLVSLLGATVGLASIFQDLTRQSLIRELGATSARGGEPFLRAYNSSYVVCGGAAALALASILVILAITPLLRISPALVAPARWLVASEGASILLMILLAPAMNMLAVRERFVALNLYTTLRRANYLLVAELLFYAFHVTDPARAVTLFGILPALLNMLLLLGFAGRTILKDPALIPRFRWIDRREVRAIAGVFGWNSGVLLAINLHERVAALLMNFAFGLVGNTIFGLALRLVSYVRMATMGMTFGVDAVSARIASEGSLERMRQLIRQSTRLHALVAIPGAVIVFILVEPLLTLWIGRHLEPDSPIIPLTVDLVRVMMIGLSARAISDGWTRILYGAGHVRRYAPLVLLGGLSNPVITGILLLTLPQPVRHTAVGWGYTFVFVVVHLLILPVIGARATKLSVRDYLAPIVRPTLLAFAAAPILIVVARQADQSGWSLLWLAFTFAAYSAMYGLLTVTFVLTSAERTRVVRVVQRFLPGSP